MRHDLYERTRLCSHDDVSPVRTAGAAALLVFASLISCAVVSTATAYSLASAAPVEGHRHLWHRIREANLGNAWGIIGFSHQWGGGAGSKFFLK